MGLVQIKIKNDDKINTYIKTIRDYDKSVSIGDIKRKIESNQFVYEFDLSGNHWIHMENMTQYQWHMSFLDFVNKLNNKGAELEIFINGNKESMVYLENKIQMMKEIMEDCEKYPD